MQQLNTTTTTIRTSSDGAWQGDNPLNYAFPLLIVQSTLVLFTSRFLAFLLKPLRQPKVIAEILGGILLGPSALGRNKSFLHMVFPPWSIPILESVASIGLLFFLFLVGLELDLSSIKRSGRKAFGIALAGISLPFLFATGVTFLLRKVVHGEERVGYSQFLVFMGVALSITAFPVLARILAELKLLTTDVGETAMAAAAFNDVAAWILLALAVAVAGNGAGGGQKSPLISIWVLASGALFVAVMLLAVRPMMNWVARQCSPEHDFVDEAYICLTLAGVMISGFMTDLIGIHAIFGAFVFGLTIPNGEFATRLIKRIEDFVSGLLLPLYFASSGLKTDVAKIRGFEAWGLLVLVISTASAGKILGTFMVAMLCMIPVRESLALGVLMNTKGLVELIVLNIGKEKKVLNDEMFAILVLMALFTTFMTTPTVMAIYRPTHGGSPGTRRRLQRQLPVPESGKVDQLRVLACTHGPKNVPSLIKFIDLMRTAPSTNFSVKLYAMHLVELTNRSSSIMMVQRARKNGVPFINSIYRGAAQDQVATAFQAYSQVGQITVRHSTAISALSTMHEDIYHVAEEKQVAMIILPFHKLWRGENKETVEVENVGHGWREVNRKVLENAPCTVAVLVDRGLGNSLYGAGEESTTIVPKRICIMFFGGPDDREVLELGGRMAENKTTSTRITFLRFFENPRTEINSVAPWYSVNTCRERRHSCPTPPVLGEGETELDEAAVTEFTRRHDSADYVEKHSSNIVEEVLAIGRSGEYDLVLVGKGRFPSNIQRKLAGCRHEMEHEELGLVGDILAQCDKGIMSSVLVIQQHGSVSTETSEALAIRDKDAMIIDSTIINQEISA